MSVIHCSTRRAGKITMGRTQYHQSIIKTGYIFNRNYQKQFQFDTEIGVKERQSLLQNIEGALSTIDYSSMGVLHHELYKRGNNITLDLELLDMNIKFNFDTISSIVTQNKDRKINMLDYYPYDKSMDKYNSVYVSVITNSVTEESYRITDYILQNVMTTINIYRNEYLFKSMIMYNPLAF